MSIELCGIVVEVLNTSSSQETSACGSRLKNVKITDKTAVNGFSGQPTNVTDAASGPVAASTGAAIHLVAVSEVLSLLA